MDKSEYLMDVLTPAALDRVFETHKDGQVEIGNLPYFSNSDEAHNRIVESFKVANDAIIEDIKNKLVYAQYEFTLKAKIKAMIVGIGQGSESGIDYANDEFDQAEKNLNRLMDKYNTAIRVRSNLNSWFR